MMNYTSSDRNTIYDRAIAKWGEAHQIVKCVEEMSELIKEICKSSEGAKNQFHMAEEIADVQITMEQLTKIFGLEELVKYHRDMKIFRLEKRIENE